MLIDKITCTPVGADLSALRALSRYPSYYVNVHYRPSSSEDNMMSAFNSQSAFVTSEIWQVWQRDQLTALSYNHLC